MYTDDEGYYSPITPKDMSIPSPGQPTSHSSSVRYPLHPNTDSIPPPQSHSHRFMYPSTTPSSSSSASYPLPPPVSHGGGGHLGVQHQGQSMHPMGSPRRTSEQKQQPQRQVWSDAGSEPMPSRQVWGDAGPERLPDASRQHPGHDEMTYHERMRSSSSGQLQN